MKKDTELPGDSKRIAPEYERGHKDSQAAQASGSKPESEVLLSLVKSQSSTESWLREGEQC